MWPWQAKNVKRKSGLDSSFCYFHADKVERIAMAKGASTIIGIDLGGTRIKTGLIDIKGEVLFSKNYATDVKMGKDQVLKKIVRIIKQLVEISKKKWASPGLIGLGSPGMIDRDEGIVRLSPNFPDWKEVPLARFISNEVGLPAFIDNDANVVTYGEKWVGAGKDLTHFACLTLGTGVGSGLILNGRPWYGSQGSGPEFGHTTVLPKGDRCNCGNRGCLETLASAPYLVKKAQQGLDKKIPTLLRETLAEGSRDISAKLLYETARQGDPFCLSLFAEMGKFLGIALANLVHTLGIEGVVLGGGVSKAATIFLPYLEKEFKKRLTMMPPDRVSIRISSLGEKSGILGAAKMAMDRSKRVPKA
jgi:glucokinase